MAEVGTPPVRAERKDRAAGAWTNLVEEADDGGEGTAEPVVNVYTKLKDNKRCASCALWGRRRFFGDWEWREAKPRCKKCVKDSEKAKDAAKFGKRANFIAMNRTASTTRGGTASDFGESNEANGGARAVRANSAQARASDASRRIRSIAALRERRLSAGSNANGDGFGGRDDDDDDEYDATSPPNRFSPDGASARASLSAFASRGTPRAANLYSPRSSSRETRAPSPPRAPSRRRRRRRVETSRTTRFAMRFSCLAFPRCAGARCTPAPGTCPCASGWRAATRAPRATRSRREAGELDPPDPAALSVCLGASLKARRSRRCTGAVLFAAATPVGRLSEASVRPTVAKRDRATRGTGLVPIYAKAKTEAGRLRTSPG